MLPCPFWKTEKRKEMAKLYHVLPWWVLITLHSELIINPGFCGDCFSYEVSTWNLCSTSSWRRKSQLQKSNKVIREGGCACVYRSIDPTGFICISQSKMLTLKLEVLSCSKSHCFDLLFLMHLFIYSVQPLIFLLSLSSTLKLGKIVFS